MKNLIIGFISTILMTILFSLTGKSLIIMYIILAMELGIIIKTKKENKVIQKEITKEEILSKKTDNKTDKIIKPSHSKCKDKVKIKRLIHKR